MPNKNKIYEDPFISGRDVKGLKEKGNIDLTKRPIVKNSDGSISTVRSISVEFDGEHVLIPTVSDDGKLLSDEEAIEAYRKTGKHLGKFSSSEDATKYSKELHGTQALYYGEGVEQNVNYTPKENVTGNLPIKLGEQMSFSPSSTWNTNSELYPKQTLETITTPTATTTTPKGSTGKGLWDGLNLGQYETLAGVAEPGGFEQPLLDPNYSVSEAAQEKLSEENTPTQKGDSLMSYLMDRLGDNLKNNKSDVIKDRAFNDLLSIGELANNLNEPPYNDISKIEAGKMQSVKMSNDTMIDNIDRQKNSQIKYMRSIGRQDLIPSIVSAADNKKAEMLEQLNNTNANLENAARQTNLQTETQTKATNIGIDQFNRQMFERAELNKGAAVSQNITNLRQSNRDFTNNMTGIRDNDLTYLMYMSAGEDPKVKDAIANYLYQQSRRRKNNKNQYIYESQAIQNQE